MHDGPPVEIHLEDDGVIPKSCAHRSPRADTLAGAGAIRPQVRLGPRGHRKDPLR